MTLQAKILPWSLCGPSHIPPLLLSSSKGFRDKRGKEQVFVGTVGGWRMYWSVDCLEREDTKEVSPTPQTYSLTQIVPQSSLKPLQSLTSIGGYQRGLRVDRRWNVKNSFSDRCGSPGEKS